jgi:nucleoside-diphosphate-sugar epimerase
MKILIIGGTAFIGPHVVRQLAAQGHEVAVFHRGKTEADLPASVLHFHGDQDKLSEYRAQIKRFGPDAVIAMLVVTRAGANIICEALSGIAPRLVVPSSIDVYRAYGRLWKTEPGPPDPVPLTEESPLRQVQSIHGEGYDKTAVEEVVMSQDAFQATIVRLPMVYGPGDYQHRLFEHLKRMDDGRQAIIMAKEVAGFRGSRGYVENVAAAIALAATNPNSAGHTYNVAEEPAFSEGGWAEQIGAKIGWKGRVATLPMMDLPERFRADVDFNQHFVVSSSKIRSELGYSEIVPFDEGLRRTIAWERANSPAMIDPEKFNYAEEDVILAAQSLT